VKLLWGKWSHEPRLSTGRHVIEERDVFPRHIARHIGLVRRPTIRGARLDREVSTRAESDPRDSGVSMPRDLRSDDKLNFAPVDGDGSHTRTLDLPSCNLSSKPPGQRSRRVLVVVTVVPKRAKSTDDDQLLNCSNELDVMGAP
jgi:hypothetical protein